ncbi:hypothetical protein [Paraburkholderia sp. D1E]|uniref:hypothetical protein n=1 Tax=Paraburkholderia sp. D1E TaxID=3461398 RepID=UPI00404651EA
MRDLSLANHLALIGCTMETGSRHHLNELTRITYQAFCLWEAGYGDVTSEVFRHAEAVLDRAVARAEKTGVWRLEESESPPLKEVLCMHDRQIAVVSTRVFLEAKMALGRLLQIDHVISPIQRRLGRAADGYTEPDGRSSTVRAHD